MMKNEFALIELSMKELATVEGGFGIPGWLKTVGHAVGHAATSALREFPPTALVPSLTSNKKAIGHGLIWAGGGAIAGSPWFPIGTIAGAAGGYAAGYADSVYSQHGG